MKVRNHRKREWQFFPPEDSGLKKHFYKFKHKAALMKFLTGHLDDAINGTVRLHEEHFGGSSPLRRWDVWYNDKQYQSGATLKAELRQNNFRGCKYIFKPQIVSKSSKKHFAFSDKVISLMCEVRQEDGTIQPSTAKNLVRLFEKRGFKDFEPTEEDWTYINGHISDGIDFFHWSDRCNMLRTKTVIEYFKRNNLLN